MIQTARRESSAGVQRLEGQLLPEREIGKLPRRADIGGVRFGGVLRDRAGEGIGLDPKTGALFSSPCSQGTLAEFTMAIHIFPVQFLNLL